MVAERLEPKGEGSQGQDGQPAVIDVDTEEQVAMGAIETKAEFDEVVIWDHDTTPDGATDPYVRSIEEWLTIADHVRLRFLLARATWLTSSIQIHSYSSEAGS